MFTQHIMQELLIKQHDLYKLLLKINSHNDTLHNIVRFVKDQQFALLFSFFLKYYLI